MFLHHNLSARFWTSLTTDCLPCRSLLNLYFLSRKYPKHPQSNTEHVVNITSRTCHKRPQSKMSQTSLVQHVPNILSRTCPKHPLSNMSQTSSVEH
ncbi:unnamed protein product, partial [Candidula unifasciata]